MSVETSKQNAPFALSAPLKFEPVLLDKLWGGGNLFKLLGKGNAHRQNIGESWELSDNDTAQNSLAEGPLKGQSFRDVFQRHRKEILGCQFEESIGRFPLLNKFIDANDNLSVQVHPGEGSPLGDPKTECWYVVHAPPGGEIIVGIDSNRPREEILEMLKTSQAREVLKKIPVSKGDVLFIPAGTVHAITRGLVIYEVQQNSDTTFRLYDWDRVDKKGRPRELHINKAVQCVDFTVHDHHKIPPLTVRDGACSRDYLVACPFFALVRYHRMVSDIPLDLNNHFTILTCLAGGAELVSAGGSAILHLGETALLPALCGRVTLFPLAPESEMLASFVPLIQQEIQTPLRNAGFSNAEIRKLGGRKGLTHE